VAFDLAVVGASLGGLHALSALLAALPATFPLPLVIVQHRGREADESLLSALRRASGLPLVEAEDKQMLQPGAVYLAPADYHLLVERGSLALSTEGPVLYARPAIDVLFESAADAYAERVIGVVLTGASADGAQGLAAIKARGGCAIVQEPADAECPVMPQAALDAAPADYVLPLAEIAPLLIRLSRVMPKVRT
jgi:two-component system chemotaxis response regulator CheB